MGIFTLWFFFLQDLPSPYELTTRNQEVSTKIYDRNGVLLYKIFKDKNRSPVPIEQIPEHVQLATLAIEDAEFYQHPGFSVRGIARAIIYNYQNEGELTGGSTITQQLVKNTLLSTEKTYRRKIREIVLAFLVEWNFNKHQILQMYLNEVSYGGTAYGIQEASRYYFAKDANKLTLGEAALLAGLPKSPTTYSPFGQNPQYAKGRQKQVLRLMEINGYITNIERRLAETKPITFAPNRIDIKAPHFVLFVRKELEEAYGSELVETGGLEVITTIDLALQEKIEQIVSDEVDLLENLKVGNGAVVVMNPKNGEILAMVGSIDYFNTQRGGNINMTTRPRQPGSSIKVVNYTYALENGKTASSIIADSPVTYHLEGEPPYSPRNYSGNFSGNMTLRNAFAQSKNIPAVKVLNEHGVEAMLKQGKKMGITTWDDPRGYGLSLTLGGGDVKLVDLARTYATIANSGKRPPVAFVKKLSNHEGKVILESTCDKAAAKKTQEEKEDVYTVKTQNNQLGLIGIPNDTGCTRQVVDERVAFIITDILKDNRARTPVFGSRSQLVIPNHPEVAVKTGTSNNLRDNLTVGYTKDYVVAVWVGNNNNTPMSKIASGMTGASTIFNKVMTQLLKEKESYTWEVPDGLLRLPICPITGTLACNGCPVIQEWFLEENKPTRACSPEWFRKDEKETSGPEGQRPGGGEILPEAASTEAI